MNDDSVYCAVCCGDVTNRHLPLSKSENVLYAVSTTASAVTLVVRRKPCRRLAPSRPYRSSFSSPWKRLISGFTLRHLLKPFGAHWRKGVCWHHGYLFFLFEFRDMRKWISTEFQQSLTFTLCSGKKGPLWFLPITLQNVDWFSELCQRHTQHWSLRMSSHLKLKHNFVNCKCHENVQCDKKRVVYQCIVTEFLVIYVLLSESIYYHWNM